MNPLLRIPAALVLLVLFAVGLSGCGQETTATVLAPPNEFDAIINEYEKTVNEYVRVAKKHQTGDVSITVKLITDEQLIRQATAKLQEQSAKLTSAQTQRIASISARTTPYLK